MQSFSHRALLIRQCRKPLFVPRATDRLSQCLGKPIRYESIQKREFSDVPAFLVPPMVFGGLFIGLWTWKCLVMIVFQNKIIYIPGLPPNARGEKIEDYKSQCSRVEWREERIKSLDGTRISLCVASVTNGIISDDMNTVYILYFQGNASSIPPRLPFLSPVLRLLRDKPLSGQAPVRYTMVCCSYRGYWTSKGRPTERGISMDAAAALKWVGEHERRSGAKNRETPIVVWGQSIGSGVASILAARQDLFSEGLVLKFLILETPFLSIRAMLETLYPQKWLPYKYLWPFLRNHLDSDRALGIMQQSCTANHRTPPRVLILEAGRDELVPKEHGDALEARCNELGLDAKRQAISGALHTEVLVRSGGSKAVAEAIQQVARELHEDQT